MIKTKYKTIDEYLKHYPKETQELLEEIREMVKKEEPDATEGISYGVPTFYINGKYFFYMAAFAKHLSVYPAPRGVKGFEELEDFKGGKGTVQLPLDKPLPMDLLRKIVKYRIAERENSR